MFLDASLAPNSPAIPTSVGLAILSAYVLDACKRIQSIPKISYYSTRLNTWIRVLMAGAGTLGVSYAWNSATGGGHTLLITLPSWPALSHGIFAWAVAYGVQHFAEIQLSQRPLAQETIRAQGPVTTSIVPKTIDPNQNKAKE
jgi:hypothetical protein